MFNGGDEEVNIENIVEEVTALKTFNENIDPYILNVVCATSNLFLSILLIILIR